MFGRGKREGGRKKMMERVFPCKKLVIVENAFLIDKL